MAVREIPLYVASPLAAVGNSATQWATASLNQDGALRLELQFAAIHAATASLNMEIKAFRSLDGGATFDSFACAFTALQITRNPSTYEKKSFDLPGGYYVFAMCNGTPVTATLGLLTCKVITAVG